MSEIYVNITGYPNYQVSNFGNVKNVKTGRILKPALCTGGYLMVVLMNDGDKSAKKNHKLVASEFLQNPEHFPAMVSSSSMSAFGLQPSISSMTNKVILTRFFPTITFLRNCFSTSNLHCVLEGRSAASYSPIRSAITLYRSAPGQRIPLR